MYSICVVPRRDIFALNSQTHHHRFSKETEQNRRLWNCLHLPRHRVTKRLFNIYSSFLHRTNWLLCRMKCGRERRRKGKQKCLFFFRCFHSFISLTRVRGAFKLRQFFVYALVWLFRIHKKNKTLLQTKIYALYVSLLCKVWRRFRSMCFPEEIKNYEKKLRYISCVTLWRVFFFPLLYPIHFAADRHFIHLYFA